MRGIRRLYLSVRIAVLRNIIAVLSYLLKGYFNEKLTGDMAAIGYSTQDVNIFTSVTDFVPRRETCSR